MGAFGITSRSLDQLLLECIELLRSVDTEKITMGQSVYQLHGKLLKPQLF